jgi:hypothetical protein
MTFVPHRKHKYWPPWPVTGIALHFKIPVNTKCPQRFGPEFIWLHAQPHIRLCSNSKPVSRARGVKLWRYSGRNIFQGHNGWICSLKCYMFETGRIHSRYFTQHFSRLQTRTTLATPGSPSSPPYIGRKVITPSLSLLPSPTATRTDARINYYIYKHTWIPKH